ncbi:MAG TPA: S49 family peptidase [Candidatus Obscuribacterales bacterium]
MTMPDVFWMFILVMLLQPVLRQKMLESARNKLFRRMEQRRGSRVIALVHRQEVLNLLGFPLFRYIDMQDSESILKAIRMTAPDVPIDLILHTPGGLSLATEQIVHALRRHPGKVTVFIPHYAMSGGALIAFAADEIVMTQNAVVGSVDPQIGGFPAASILKTLDAKPFDEIDDKTLIWADAARKSIQQMRQTLVEILSPRMEEAQAVKMAELLTSGTWTVDYPISAEELQEMGFVVSTQMPVDVMWIMNLYPQPSFGRPSVDFIPAPYHLPDIQKGRK